MNLCLVYSCNMVPFLVKPDSFAAILYVNALNNFFLSFMVPTVVELGVEGMSIFRTFEKIIVG